MNHPVTQKILNIKKDEFLKKVKVIWDVNKTLVSDVLYPKLIS